MHEIEPLTTEQKFETLAESLAWFIPRLLARGIDGQVARRAAVEFLRSKQLDDADAGVDVVARRLFAETLRRYDGDLYANAEFTGDNLMRLLRTMQPDEVAQLIDSSTPPVLLEQLGSAVDVLSELEAEYAASGTPEVFDKLDDVTDSAMPFAEGSTQAGPVRMRAKHLSPADARTVANESLRRACRE